LLRLLDIQDDSKSAFQLGIIDSRKILLEQCLGSSTVRLQNSLAQLRAGPPEKIEIHPLIMRPAEPVDFISDREHAESIGIVVRQGEAQDCHVPGPQSPRLPLGWTSLIHCDALCGDRSKGYQPSAAPARSSSIPAMALAIAALAGSSQRYDRQALPESIKPSKLNAYFTAAGTSFERKDSSGASRF
jgi:hypothetical protein